MKRAEKKMLTIACMFICGAAAAITFLPMAAAERGYTGAVGSEWLLVILAIYGGGILGEKLFKLVNGIK